MTGKLILSNSTDPAQLGLSGAAAAADAAAWNYNTASYASYLGTTGFNSAASALSYNASGSASNPVTRAWPASTSGWYGGAFQSPVHTFRNAVQ